MNTVKSISSWLRFPKQTYLLSLTVGIIFFCLALGAAIALEANFLVAIILMPVLLLYAVIIPISENHQKRIFFLLGTFLLTIALMWPRYSYIRLGGLPGLTPTRIILAIFLFVAFTYLFRSKKIQSYLCEIKLISYHPLIYIFIFSIFRFLSVIFASDPFASLYGFLNETIFFTIMTMLFLLAFRTLDDIEEVIHLLMYVTFLICTIGFVEYIFKQNIFSNVLPVTEDYTREALQSKMRDSGYRIQSTFDHPLTYSQFLVSVLPLLVSLFFFSKNTFIRIITFLTFFMALISILLTGSRSAAILSFFSLLMLGGGILLLQFIQQKVRLIIIIFTVFLLILFTVLGVLFVDQIQSLISGRSTAEASSTSARILMLRRAIPLIFDSPLVGYGVNQAAALIGFVGAGGVLTIDSLPISFSVESGVVALLAYFLCIFSAIIFSLRTAIQRNNRNMILQLALATSVFIFFMTTITLSLSGNMFFLAFLLAAVLAVRNQSVAR